MFNFPENINLTTSYIKLTAKLGSVQRSDFKSYSFNAAVSRRFPYICNETFFYKNADFLYSTLPRDMLILCICFTTFTFENV